MKIIRTFSGREFIIADDEAKNIKRAIDNKNDRNSFVELRSGDALNLDRIENISEPKKIAYISTCDGIALLNPDGISFNREGNKIYLKPSDFEDIKFITHPLYEQELKQILEQVNEKVKQLTKKNGQTN